MTESIYATPEADVSAPALEDHERYYVVGKRKFLILSIVTFGAYFWYWSYRQWAQIKRVDNDDLWPIPRGIFYIFFTHALFTDIDAHLKNRGQQFDWQPMLLATVFVVLTVLNNLSEDVIGRIAPQVVASPWYIIGSLALVFFLPLLVLPAQRAANLVCDDPDGAQNARLTAANFAWLLAFGLLWVFAAIGSYYMITEPALFAE